MVHNKHESMEQDRELIKYVVEGMETAFNRHDADALDSHFTQNATWVNVMGEKLSGWDEINKVHKIVLAGPLINSFSKYTVDSISFINSDAAVVHVRQHSTTSDGKRIDGGQQSIAIYVMVKETNVWKLAAGQNTLLKSF
ncbi:SgcJ/EcaC family oxidoreductase [Paenibacillus sp. GCM10027627]|uniref:SgcJ/EcaC family oxidoreductase n=1 Tax=unclassified Paenibacillus TaxID=185978 RepID=UPI00363FFFE8